MLKIERDRSLSLTFHSNEPFLSRSFLIALWITLLCHLFCFFLFKIDVLNLRPQKKVIPFTEVISQSGPSLIAEPKNDDVKAHLLLKRPQPIPRTFMPSKSLATGLPLIPFSVSLTDPGSVVIPVKMEPRVLISGPLKEHEPILPTWDPPTSDKSYHLSYKVALDPINGHLLWYEPLQRTSNPSLEMLIRQLRVDKLNGGPILKGVIEFIYD